MDALLFVNHHKVRDTELQNEETLRALRMDVGANLEFSLLVHKPDAQEVVPELPREPSMSLGDGTPGNDDGQFNGPIGAAFVPACPHLLVTTEFKTHCVKVSDIRTGAMVCKFGERGRGEGQFTRPWGVAITSDSSFVLIAELSNNRVQVLRLVISAEYSPLPGTQLGMAHRSTRTGRAAWRTTNRIFGRHERQHGRAFDVLSRPVRGHER